VNRDGDSRALPYSVEPTGRSAGIFKLGPGRFHVWRPGALGSLLDAAAAILVSRDLADALAAETRAGWRSTEATIFDPQTGDLPGYVELLVDAELGLDALPADVSGKQVWRYGLNTLFVSPDLVSLLGPRFSDLRFSAGFSGFAGGSVRV
jgi:hypothetical protein